RGRDPRGRDPTGADPYRRCSRVWSSCTPFQQYEVVAVHDLPFVGRPERGGQLRGAATQQGGQLDGVVVDQAPRHRPAVAVDQVDRVAGDETTVDRGDPGRQQGLAPLDHRGDRTRVEVQPPARGGGVGQPVQPGGGPALAGQEPRADRFAGQRAAGEVGAGEDHRDAGAGGDPGRLHLRDHAAGTDPGAAGRSQPYPGQVVLGGHHLDPPRARPGRVTGPQPVHIGQEQERVRVDQGGDQRGQPVVVAEPDLVGGDGVVLVDDRDRAEVEQGAQGAVRVAVVGAPGHVVGG